MSANKLSASRARQILSAATKTRVLVVGIFAWLTLPRVADNFYL
jgi:hypothetical protein